MGKQYTPVKEQAGWVPFQVNAAWEVYRTGEPQEQTPLLVYLHGYGENITGFREKTNSLQAIPGLHLFIQGPYPLPRPGMKNRGYSWYVYDGPDSDFAAELAKATELVESVVAKITSVYSISEVISVGFSMGAYLGGYWALFGSHPPDLLAACGGRIKTELLHHNEPVIKPGIRKFAAIHGKDDKAVVGEHQQKAVDELIQYGFEAEMIWVDSGHAFDGVMENAVKRWVIQNSSTTARNI